MYFDHNLLTCNIVFFRHYILKYKQNILFYEFNLLFYKFIRQIKIHTAELLPDPSSFEVEIAIAKLKRYKSPGSDQIPAKLIQAGGDILCSKIHELINSVWNTEQLPEQWKESIIVPVHKKVIKLTAVIIIGGYHYYQLRTKLY
jgi:hypothetical protein